MRTDTVLLNTIFNCRKSLLDLNSCFVSIDDPTSSACSTSSVFSTRDASSTANTSSTVNASLTTSASSTASANVTSVDDSSADAANPNASDSDIFYGFHKSKLIFISVSCFQIFNIQ